MRLSKLGVVLLALAFAFPLLAQKEGAGLPHKCGAMPELTAEQTAKLQKLALEHQKAMIPLKAELKTKRLDFQQLMMEGADQKKLEAKIDEIAKANADIQKKCLLHRSAALGLLTAEQKKAMPQGCLTMGGGRGMGGHQSDCGMHAQKRLLRDVRESGLRQARRRRLRPGGRRLEDERLRKRKGGRRFRARMHGGMRPEIIIRLTKGSRSPAPLFIFRPKAVSEPRNLPSPRKKAPSVHSPILTAPLRPHGPLSGAEIFFRQ